MTGEIRKWDVSKIDIKPGNILVLRYHRPMFPGVAGDVPLSGPELEKVLERGTKVFRESLDSIGYTVDKVPVIALTEEWDIAVLNPLELMDKCALAARAKEAAEGD